MKQFRNVDINSQSGDVVLANDNVNVTGLKELLPPIAVIERYLSNKGIEQQVANTRNSIQNILHGKDDRLLIVVGPCSIHDPEAAIDYAKQIKPLIDKYKNELLILMRVYFEKPRTTIGWKGLINDPYLDGSCEINDGIRIARKLLRDINDLGVPAATEFLDLITPQYITDLISWGAIGARTTESQIHRELASGISCPIGFKNGTNGDVKIAIDAMLSASSPHTFIGINKFGSTTIVDTTGNKATQVILRGGDKAPNYDANSVSLATDEIAKTGFYPSVMIDFSHANSSKDYTRQSIVCEDVAQQIASGSRLINAVMIESNLVAGNQKIGNLDKLVYGQSVTDACVDMNSTDNMLQQLAQSIKSRRSK